MLYQIGLIAVIVVAALILVKKFSHSKDELNDLVYEDEMDDEELNSIDKEIH
tara:strand:- start:218 stop:373 length:156 start_codon:yes stop_codon:yes gene_type:complete